MSIVSAEIFLEMENILASVGPFRSKDKFQLFYTPEEVQFVKSKPPFAGSTAINEASMGGH